MIDFTYDIFAQRLTYTDDKGVYMKRVNRGMLFIFIAGFSYLAIPVLASFGINVEHLTGDKTWDGILMVCIILIPIAVILFFTGKTFIKPFLAFTGRASRKILREGRPGAAIIMSIGENSEGGTVTINDQPYLNLKLEIRDGSKDPYMVSIDTVIPRASLPQFQPGAVIPIKIHPTDPQKVAIDWQASSVPDIQMEKPTYGGEHYSVTDDNLIKREGIDGYATIMDVLDTGKSKDFNPVVEVYYTVERPDTDPYSFAKEMTIPTEVVHKFKKVIGKKFKARIHPHDRTKMVIDVKFI